MNFRLSGNLIKFTDFNKMITIDIDEPINLKEALLKLIQCYPNLGQVLIDSNNNFKLSCFYSVNGNKSDPNNSFELVNESAKINIFTAIAGG